jgi:hypothetical protein
MKATPTIFSLLLSVSTLAAPDSADVVVYGGTPAGIAAACLAADQGRTVILVEPYRWVGGMVTNGLSHTDLRSVESTSGFWWDYTQRVKKHYADSDALKNLLEGNFAEPWVSRMIFEQMLAERKSVTVLKEHRLDGVRSTRSMPSSILGITLKKGTEKAAVSGKMFIDASYEGDLMARAGCKFAVGREDEAAYGESLAKDVPRGGDGQVQGYNFRWCMTQVKENMASTPKPEGYDRADFLPVLKLYADGRMKQAFGEQNAKAPFKVQPPLLPGGKTDINDMSHGLVRLSMPDINDAYPTADEATRQRIYDAHLRYQLGLLWFLQNDDEVPQAVREDARSWGFCKDEWPENNHIPEQLYIREARRMIGMHVFTQNDTKWLPEDVRLPLKTDSIAIGDYSHNCHGTGRVGGRFDGKHTGEFYQRNAPFQIPYGTIVPNDVKNLLVPVAASSSHVGFGALRLEPIWTAMGHAAGLAAHLALGLDAVDVKKISTPRLQSLLHKTRAATVYVSDVRPDSPDFVATQWLAQRGGFHRTHTPKDGKQPEWKKLFGQYCHAYPLHEARLDDPMDDTTYANWVRLCPPGAVEPHFPVNGTRGGCLRDLYKISSVME